MTLVNRAAHTQNVRLEMSVVPNDGTVTIYSPLLGEPVQVDRDSPSVDRILPLPTGQHEIRFVSDAGRGYPPTDLSQRGFVVENFRLTPTQGPIRDPDPNGERHSRVMKVDLP
jgi:hypothetical protein